MLSARPVSGAMKIDCRAQDVARVGCGSAITVHATNPESPSSSCCGHFLELARHALKDAGPIVGSTLTKQPHRGIPGTVFAAPHPTPLAGLGQCDPHGYSQSAGHVGDTCV